AHARHPPDDDARRERPAQPRCQHDIARLDKLGLGDVLHAHAALKLADHRALSAGALETRVDRAAGVVRQSHPGGVRGVASPPPGEPPLPDPRLAPSDAVTRSPVDDSPALVAAGIAPDDVRRHKVLVGVPRPVVHQPAEAVVVAPDLAQVNDFFLQAGDDALVLLDLRFELLVFLALGGHVPYGLRGGG